MSGPRGGLRARPGAYGERTPPRPMRVSYHEGYYAPLPSGHAFPMGKFPALHRLLLEEGVIRPADVVAPREMDGADLLLVHTPDYLGRFAAGTLSKAEVRRMGLPWSEALVRRSRLAARGTLNAALMALEDGVAANLAGGTHHAFPDHGEGFCIFNDVAIAIRALQRAGWIARALVVDLDVHQGNGTAAIFEHDARVYTFSVHGAKNFPFRKERSSRDVELPDGTGDDAYLEALRAHLPAVIADACADVVFYLGGIDVLADDRFGRLALTRDGLRRRDAYALETLGETGIPVVLLLSGGYAPTPEETADRHATMHREAKRVFG